MPVYVQHELLGKVSDVFCADAIWQPSSLSLFSRRPLLRDLLERAPREHRGRQPTRCFAHVTVLLPQDDVDDDRHLTRGARVRDLADALAALHRRDFGDLLGADEVRYRIEGSERLAPGEVEVRFGHAIYLPGPNEQALHQVSVSRDGVVWNPVCQIYPEQRLALIGAATCEAGHALPGWAFPGDAGLLLINDGPDAPVEVQVRPKGALDCRFDARQDCHVISQSGTPTEGPGRLLLRVTRRMARLPAAASTLAAEVRAPVASNANGLAAPARPASPHGSEGQAGKRMAPQANTSQLPIAGGTAFGSAMPGAIPATAPTAAVWRPRGEPVQAAHDGSAAATIRTGAMAGSAAHATHAPAMPAGEPDLLASAVALQQPSSRDQANEGLPLQAVGADFRANAAGQTKVTTAQACSRAAHAASSPDATAAPVARTCAAQASEEPGQHATGEAPDLVDATYAPVAHPCRVVLAALALPRLSRYLDTGAHELVIGLDLQLKICPEGEPPALTLGVDREDRLFAETAAGRQQIGTNAIFTPFSRGRIELRDAEGLLAERYLALLRLPHTPGAPLPARVRFTFGRNAPMLEQLRVLNADRFLRAPGGPKGSADRIGLSRQAFSFEAVDNGYAIRGGSPNQALYHLDPDMQLLARIDQVCADVPYLLPAGHHLVAGHYVLRFEA
jgi:hypothetical protein